MRICSKEAVQTLKARNQLNIFTNEFIFFDNSCEFFFLFCW